jgi:hypothetical protein
MLEFKLLTLKYIWQQRSSSFQLRLALKTRFIRTVTILNTLVPYIEGVIWV